MLMARAIKRAGHGKRRTNTLARAARPTLHGRNTASLLVR